MARKMPTYTKKKLKVWKDKQAATSKLSKEEKERQADLDKDWRAKLRAMEGCGELRREEV